MPDLGRVWLAAWRSCTIRVRAKDTRPFKLSTTRATIEVSDSNVFFNELRRHIGANLNSYRARKRAMIRSLGYSSSPFSVKFTAEGTEIDGLVDHFLGLRPSADVAVSPLIETRFGIDVPFGPGKQDGESRASLTMLDFPHLRRTFWLTGDDGEGCVESVEVEGKIFNPLSIGFVLPLSHLKWRFVSEQLEFVASSHEFSFTARAMPDELAMADLPTWRRVRQIFLGAKVIRLAARSLPPLEFQRKAALTEDEILYFQSLRDACEVASGITLPPSQMIQPEALYRQRDNLAVMAALLKRDGRQLLPAMEKDYPPGTIVGAVFYLTARFGEVDGLIAGKVEAVVTTTGGLSVPSVRCDICQYWVGSVPDEIRGSAITMLNAHKADLKAKGVYLGQIARHAPR